MKIQSEESVLWFLGTVSRIALMAALIGGTVTLLFYLRFDPEPPTDSEVLKTMLEGVYEERNREVLRDNYRRWHYLSLGAYFSGRDQYNRGVVITLVFTLIHFASSGAARTLRGLPIIRKKNPKKKISVKWETAGLAVLILALIVFPFFEASETAGSGSLPQVFVTPLESSEGNWSSFRGPLGGQSSSESPDPEQLEEIWTFETSRQGHSSPVIWGDAVYLTGADEGGLEFMKVDLQSGELLWTADFPVDPSTLPEVSFDTGWAPSTPVCSGDGVFGLFGNGSLIALDHDGELLWTESFGVPDNPYGHASSLAIYQGRLYVQYDQSDQAFLKAFDSKTGGELWSRERPAGPSWSSPVPVFVNGKAMIVTAADPRINAYNPFTGEEIWSTESLYGEVAPTIAWDDEKLYAVQEGAGVAALSLETGEILWRNEEGPQSDVSSPVVSASGLIMPTSYGILSLYDRESGELLSYAERYDSSYASPVLWGYYVYWPDMFGTLVIYEIQEELVLSREIPLDDEVLATPAIGGNRLIIRGRERLSAWGIPDE